MRKVLLDLTNHFVEDGLVAKYFSPEDHAGEPQLAELVVLQLRCRCCQSRGWSGVEKLQTQGKQFGCCCYVEVGWVLNEVEVGFYVSRGTLEYFVISIGH